jgi:hypothetical protein
MISSWTELREQAPYLLERVNSDAGLALRAAMNPLLALEELGQEVDPAGRQEIEDRLRFRPRAVARLRHLRKAIHKQSGRAFDIDSGAELAVVLFDELHVGQLDQGRRPGRYEKRRSLRPDTSPLPPQVGWGPKVTDPLEVLRGAHPIMEPLLEYRRLEASAPRLASPALYEAVRSGRRKLPTLTARGRLRRSAR